MSDRFSIQPIGRFYAASQPVKRPKEFACFSYDDNHDFHLGDSSLRYYYTPALGADLSKGYDSFIKHDDSKPEHLGALLKTIKAHEEETGQKIDAQIVTWRGMMTKIMASPFEDRDGYIEENHEYKVASQKQQNASQRRGPIPPEVMQFWGMRQTPSARKEAYYGTGYKFETLATLPAPWGDTPREYIENRDGEIVNNKAQYCSVVRTGIGQTVICIGGEVDAVWDSKPVKPGAPTNWVELKTSLAIRDDRDVDNFHRKLMKFWIQSFLLGVPKIIVGFRNRQGILTGVEEIETEKIPDTVQRRGKATWNADMCVNFAAEFLVCESAPPSLRSQHPSFLSVRSGMEAIACEEQSVDRMTGLRQTINDDGVWRIRRRAGEPNIEVFKIDEAGHGDVLTDEFINWRIKLSMKSTAPELEPEPEPEPEPES
ncbi:decapping nuclease RAI1 [Colletotrichum spaethianum]|uniref:Decapping nuclease n=1 Tax=Colletotrichum spaethianum TaxID=700344 RepID=A0AA37L513_9PEZI|nr:decapping nuclease RAI1 [Colletotrichum spaethianum]GKT40704.1 decapping nuclease RAI1 [Colletotrichum spaethianum]